MEQAITFDIRDSVPFELWMARAEARGQVRSLPQTILRQVWKKFGEPTPEQIQTVESLNDLNRLQDLTDKLLDVATWKELLA